MKGCWSPKETIGETPELDNQLNAEILIRNDFESELLKNTFHFIGQLSPNLILILIKLMNLAQPIQYLTYQPVP
jgi:hypothetical protein